jgi:5-(carboxyamino)imidazole ribonucleotide mutase
MTASVVICVGSDSDMTVMDACAQTLLELDIGYEVLVLSAHRTPHRMIAFGRDAKRNGHKVLIAAAGGAAHLPGMLAAATTLPVIGVPIANTAVGGMDALLSIVQMPKGVPVATVAIGQAVNAALLAAQILALSDPALDARLQARRDATAKDVEAASDRVHAEHELRLRSRRGAP